MLFRSIDLTGTLSLSSYYRTDLHWRQEMLVPTAKALADAMGVSLTEDFTAQDVLFLYSTSVLNDSATIK